jgi:cobaltochelatase CobN
MLEKLMEVEKIKKQIILLMSAIMLALLLSGAVTAENSSNDDTEIPIGVGNSENMDENTSTDEPLETDEKPKIVILNANSQSTYYHQTLRDEGEKLGELLNVTVYAGTTTNDPAIPPEEKIPADINLTDYDVVFVCGWNTGSPDLQAKLDEAKQHTNVIVINPTAISPGNVDLNAYPNITNYWSYGTAQNLRNLILYLGVEFCGVDTTVEPPATMAQIGIYHPDAPILFENLTDYLKWYNIYNHSYDPTKTTIGIMTSRSHIVNNMTKPTDHIIKTLEEKGCNVIAVYGSSTWNVDSFFSEDGELLVDAIISILYNVQNEVNNFKFLDVPILYGVGLYYESPEEWENSKEGVFPHQVSYVGLSEIYGLIEPTVVYAQIIDDITSGVYHYEPIDSQIDYITDRAIAWSKLRHMNNSDKKIVITYFNDGGGKANMGTEMEYYLDVPASIENLLHELKEQGYNLGNTSIPDLETLTNLMVSNGRNVGPWAPGELDTLVKTGTPLLIPEDTYLSWFRSLPIEKQEEVIKYWGEPPGDLMVWQDSEGKRYIVIPIIQLGNVIITPHPLRPGFAWELYQENGTFSTDQGEIPPHHQYIAFYLAMNNLFDTNAYIQMWSPFAGIAGKQVGLGKYDWNGLLLYDAINLRPFPLHFNPETHRRRGGFVIISHLSPTMVPSGLYGDLENLQQKIVLYNQVQEEGALKEEYRKTILSETSKLGLDLDLNVDLSTLDDVEAFENFIKVLDDYLNEIAAIYMPYGLHVLGDAPTNESLVAMIESMFGDTLKNDVSIINSDPGITTNLLNEVLLNGLSPEDAQIKVLGQVSEKITEDLLLALEYKDMINESAEMEMQEIFSALNGQYIQPSIYGDLVGHPELLPTGKNLYSMDGRLIPTEEAWNIGVELVKQQLQQYAETHDNSYPTKVGVVLWKSETCRHQGVMESAILYLLGVKPVYNSYNRWTDVELIPSSELGRPRIDVIITTSGSYRDMFGYKFELLEKAVKLAANANDTEYPNYVKQNSNELYQWLIENGYDSTEALELSTVRIFSHEVGRFGTGLSDVVPMSDSWEDEDEIANVYISATSYAYGKNVWGIPAEDLFRKNLDGIDIGLFSASSDVVGVLDQGVDGYLGGLALAVRSVSGKTPELYIFNLRNSESPTTETLNQFFNKELRTRYFNPKWIEGMMENNYAGSTFIEEFVEHLWKWNAEVPDLVTESMWNEVYNVYVNDKYNLGLKEFFDNNNPYAKQSIVARMLETVRKGYWNPSEDVKTTLANEYIESVVNYGVTCCHHTCSNLALNNYMVMASSLSMNQLNQFAQVFKAATGKSVTMKSNEPTPQQTNTEPATGSTSVQGASSVGEESPSTDSASSTSISQSQESVTQSPGEEGSKKSYEVTESNESSGQSNTPIMAIVGVVLIICLVGVGYFRLDILRLLGLSKK